ncbi:hypothetical protein [uncultured Clostridium sp.]|jgi:uncharacterized RDD family membrane protein YckC|uniref:hypothetical protein n=1 Tax=uncultured Clostridium sp. TaxID=59620 RepID=UPI00261F76F5|nr:hypothetical protein [uncultured Clostridium sp.]
MENNNQENKEVEIEKILETDKGTMVEKTEIKVSKEPVKGFFSRLMTGVIDQCIVIGSSLIALLIMDGIYKLLGYYIVDRVPVFFILYVAANIIYPLIMQGTRFRATFGNRLFR